MGEHRFCRSFDPVESAGFNSLRFWLWPWLRAGALPFSPILPPVLLEWIGDVREQRRERNEPRATPGAW